MGVFRLHRVTSPTVRNAALCPAPSPALRLVLGLCLAAAWLRPAPALAKSLSLDSGPRTRPIVVDAKLDDWQDALVHLKQPDIDVGVVNDGTDLYLCLESRDAEVNLQILNRGLTAWLSPHGAGEKSFGIEYPLALDKVEEISRASNALARLAIRGSTPEDRRVMAVADATGISASAVAINGTFIYEMRIPLARGADHPYFVGATPGEKIDILLETPEPQPYLKEKGDGGSRGGGHGGGGGYGGGAGGGGGGMGGHGGGHGGGGAGGYGGGGGGYGGGHGGGHGGGGSGGEGGGGGSHGGSSSDSAPSGHTSPPAPLSLLIKARLSGSSQ